MVQESQGYRDLRVWQLAMELIPKVYQVVKQLPSEERYELGSQLRRAVVSVAANIAEGQARQHTKEFLQSLYIARGSLAETETLLMVAERLGYLPAPTLQALVAELAELRKPLQGLVNRLHGQRSTGN
jgi:four helix bundle protein